MAKTNISTPSSPQQNRNIYDGPVEILWDLGTCPIPTNMCTEEAANNILMALRVHQINGAVKITAYGDFARFPQRITEGLERTAVSCKDVRNVEGAILVDMFLFALDNPPPAYIMLLSGDDNFAHALHRLGGRGYTVILAIPSGVYVSYGLKDAGSFVWDWPSLPKSSRSFSYPNDLDEVSVRHVSSNEQNDSTGVQPGDVNGLTRELVSLLESSGGQLPLDEIELEGRNKTVHIKIRLTRLEVEDGLINQRLVVFRDELKELLESFFYDIPFTRFERSYQQKFNRSLDYQSLGVSNLEELIVKMDGVAMLIEDRQSKEKHVISVPVIENRRKLLKLHVKELLNTFGGIIMFSCFEYCYKNKFEEEMDYYYYGLTDLEDLCEFLKDILVVRVANLIGAKVITAVDGPRYLRFI